MTKRIVVVIDPFKITFFEETVEGQFSLTEKIELDANLIYWLCKKLNHDATDVLAFIELLIQKVVGVCDIVGYEGLSSYIKLKCLENDQDKPLQEKTNTINIY